MAMLLATPVLAFGATPPDLSDDPLIRAGWLATQATYDVEVTTTFDALEVDGRRTAGGSFRSSGAAFGVANGGLLATAAHLVAPSPAKVAVEVYQRAHTSVPPTAAAAWGQRTKAKVIGLKVALTASRVLPDGARTEPATAEVAGKNGIDLTGDIAILRIDAPRAPVLDLAAFRRRDGRGVVVGIARALDGTPTPTYATGRLGAFRIASPYVDIVGIEAPVRAGDSGAPVVDRSGRVVGLVSQWVSGRPGGGIAPSDRIDALAREFATPGSNEAATAFRGAMKRLWASDFVHAEAAFQAAALSDDPLARFEQTRLEGLRRSVRFVETDGRLSRALIAFALACAAAACGFLLAARRRSGSGDPLHVASTGGTPDAEGPDDGMSPSPY